MKSIIKVAALVASAATVSACQQVENVGTMFDSSPQEIVADTEGLYADGLTLSGTSYAPQQARIEKELTLALTGEYGRFEEVGLQDYVNSVLERIAQAAERRLGVTDFAPRAVVVARHSEAAFATPSGGIVLSHGLLESLQNEDQLAFVLAHEAAHVLHGHHESDWLVKSQRHVLTTAELGMEALNQVGQALGDTELVGSEAQKWRLIASGALILTRDVIMPRWSQKNETEADLLGIDLMAEAGYQPREVVKVGQLLARMETAASDPASIAAEREFATWWGSTKESSPLLQQMFGEIETGFQEARADMRDTHADGAERTEALRAYAGREYRAMRNPAQLEPYEATLNQDATAAIRGYYDTASNALGLLNEGRTMDAMRMAISAAKGPAHDHSYPLLVLSTSEFTIGDSKEAIDSLNRAIKGPTPALLVYLNLSEAHAQNGDFAEAVSVAEEGRRAYGESAAITLQTISLLARSGEQSQAQALMVECKLSFPEVEQSCEDAAEGKFAQKLKAEA